MHEICVIGHVTREEVKIGGGPARRALGGAAYYSGVALGRLGLDTAVLTKTAPAEAADMLAPLQQAGVSTYACDGVRTTLFENTYPAGDLDQRTQRVVAIAEPFAPDDLEGIAAKIFHLGPLTAREMPVSFLAAVARLGSRVSLDVQGFVRAVVDGRIEAGAWNEAAQGLQYVDILKADRNEARMLTGHADAEGAARAIATMGPREVIITDGSAGSLVLAGEQVHQIPAYRLQPTVDPTGCGDTYMAGYLFSRARSDDVEGAGRCGAALASLKLEHHGPSKAYEKDVRELLRASSD